MKPQLVKYIILSSNDKAQIVGKMNAMLRYICKMEELHFKVYIYIYILPMSDAHYLWMLNMTKR